MKTTILALAVSTSFIPALTNACEIDQSVPLESYSTTVHTTDHHAVYTEININASAEKVWSVLMDFETMPEWSPALQGIVGDLADGSAVTVLYKVGDRVAEIPHVISFKDGTSFGWAEELKGPAPGIFDNHLYKVEAISECQTRFIQSDAFKGVSTEQPERTTAFFAERVLGSYRSFNTALKKQVESQNE